MEFGLVYSILPWPLINYSQIRWLWLAILKKIYFSWFRIKFQEKSKNFKELAQKLQELWTKTFGGPWRPPGLNMVNYSNGKFPYPRGKLYSEFSTPRAV